MAPFPQHAHGAESDEKPKEFKVDRKIRKPLVERQRRARINESLQELRALADSDLQSKMENAEVLELTVRRVENILQSQAQELDVVNREARERFAAGYIQCMHEVHSFVSNCPGIDPEIAADILNHLLESMPLNDEDRRQVRMSDIFSDCPPHHNNSSNSSSSTWSESGRSSPCSPGSPALSLAPSSSTDDLCSDLEETDSEQSNLSIHEGEIQDVSCLQYLSYPKSMWRPW
ncbi:unnamed protein product [Boreogadus saida]